MSPAVAFQLYSCLWAGEGLRLGSSRGVRWKIMVGRAWQGMCMEGDFPFGHLEIKVCFLCQATSLSLLLKALNCLVCFQKGNCFSV